MKNFKFHAVKALVVLICLSFSLTGFEISAYALFNAEAVFLIVIGFAVCVASGTMAALIADRWILEYE